jgi:DNA-binding MarR family transcriptional regulator
MSTVKTSTSRKAPRIPVTPLIGSLLRLPHEAVVARMLSTLHSSGLDMSLTELGVFLYPGPEDRRPIDLARQCNMSRQAMNYVLAGLTDRGYIERRNSIRTTSRVVRLTEKGWEAVARIRGCVAAIEHEWASHLGSQRFKALRESLYDLSVWLGKLP